VPQDVTDDLDVGAGVDLPAGVAMSEYMGSKHICSDTNLASIVAYAMTDGATRDRVVRHPRAQENPTRLSTAWTFPMKVGDKSFCNGRQQREIDCHSGFRSAYSQNF
jgi:hypothetical protein